MAVLGQVATEAFPQLFITTSQTWVPPQDGNVCFHLVGAGGGGFGGVPQAGHCGGAGGYIKVPTHPVTTSGSYTIVIGAGGDGGYNASASGVGSAGGNTTLAGTGLTGTKTASGGSGGGNNTGGAGGATSGSGESMVGYTGGAGQDGTGGAVGVYATGRDGDASGNPTYRGTNAGLSDAGGGGIGNSGFGVICGGSRAPTRIWDAQHVGGSANNNTSGDLCGAAQVHVLNNSATYVTGGNATIGGGGGSGINSYGDAYGYGGRGGDGIILIQYLPW